MKVLDLQCSGQHAFEGWFGSEEDFQQQLERGLIECPYCGQREIQKKLSAPRLNLGATEPKASQTQPVVSPPIDDDAREAVQVAWFNMVREVLAKTEDVGERFAEEARRIHYGEVPERGIRGQATPEQTEALREEGIAVMPLPLPHGLKGTLQ